jgi:hypothetical protein
VYSAGRSAFREDHKRVIEILGQQLAPVLQSEVQIVSTTSYFAVKK